MPDRQPVDTYSKQWSSPLLYIFSILIQAVVFLAASATLALFYLSYRPADFLQSFIVVGLVLTCPWLLISLLPTFFGLQDKELRQEILVRQLLTMLVILAILVGLAIYIDFHRELWALLHGRVVDLTQLAGALWGNLSTFVAEGIEMLTTLFNEHVRPLFST